MVTIPYLVLACQYELIEIFGYKGPNMIFNPRNNWTAIPSGNRSPIHNNYRWIYTADAYWSPSCKFS
jgi:hypothetical protein